MAQQSSTRVAMEACYMSHYWGRQFGSLGHEVQLIPAQHVKPFVRGNKNDRNDALAIAEAANRPNLRGVPMKTVEQQEVLALHRIRERLKRQRIQLMNQTRGLLAEFGLVFPKGHKAFRHALNDILNAERVSARFAEQLQQLRGEYERLSADLTHTNERIATFVAQTPSCAYLLSVPGIGPAIASAVVASVDKGQAFTSPREFAVWLGLTPGVAASGERWRPLGITKRGDRYLRTLYIHGARAALRWTRHRHDTFSRWANASVERRGYNKAVVAVAHKLARLSWVLLQRQIPFEPR